MKLPILRNFIDNQKPLFVGQGKYSKWFPIFDAIENFMTGILTKETIKIDGVYDDKGKPVIDKKTKEHKVPVAPNYQLFKKCMRGDPTDNVFSAFPGVREKGTKNKVGLVEAFADKDTKGFNWNNMMLQRWTDHEGKEHRVLDDYWTV